MSDEAVKRLADRLREARDRKGLSQEDVAQALAIPRAAVSQIENAHRRVAALELAQLAKLYAQPLSFFADEEPEAGGRLDVLRRTAAELSEKDREEVLRFAELLRSKAVEAKKRR